MKSSLRNYIPPKRLHLVILTATNSLTPQISTLLISLFVVRFHSIEIWGQYAEIMLLIMILNQLTAWGNREYLLRSYSEKPGTIRDIWQKSLSSRSILLLPATLSVFFTLYRIDIQLLIISILLTRYLSQSYDSLIVYNRNFKLKIMVEVLGSSIIILWLLLLKTELNTTLLLQTTLLIDLLKTTLLSLNFRGFFLWAWNSFSINYLRKSFLFSLLAFFGLAASRIDQITAAFYMPPADMGQYQVVMSFLLIIQALSNFILLPFVKNIYRLKIKVIKKIAANLFITGILISVVSVLIIYFVLTSFYKIELTPIMLLLAVLFTIPIFYYSAIVYLLFKLQQTSKVILLSGAGIIICFGLNTIFIPLHGVMGALLGATLTQWLLLGMYLFVIKTEKSKRTQNRTFLKM